MKYRDLVEMLRSRAAERGDQVAFTYLEDGERPVGSITFGQLDRRARAVAARLQASTEPGDRALLLFDAGLDFIAAYFGCLYAEVVAVTAFPPSRARIERSLPRLGAIVESSRPAAVLATAHIASFARPVEGDPLGLAERPWVEVDLVAEAAAGEWREPPVDADRIAFLQYTSGSTSVPKGVMVSHGNLIADLEAMHRAYELVPGGVSVTWLPSFHDLGLIDGLLESIYAGHTTYFMAPASFVQKPIRWLRAISLYGATHSGGPNFSYQLCLDRVKPEQRAELDLSTWRIAYNGAEPIRESTVREFTEYFAPCGFRASDHFPCYGLAEATLMVTGAPGGAVVRDFSSSRLAEQRVASPGGESDAIRLVSSGRPIHGVEIAIVDPETGRRCADDEIGEIWVRGDLVARGYWERPEETERTFEARVAGSGEGPYLRTGDLGFVVDGDLFVSSRLKDLIILHGRNVYPQDVELTVERSHPELRPDSGVAFSVEIAGEERLVIVHEVHRRCPEEELEAVITSVKEAVAEEHEAEVEAVVLIRHATLQKTSSGKLQRQGTRAAFLAGELQVVAEWRQPRAGEAAATPAALPATREAITGWLVERLAERAAVAPATIDPDASFASFGLDSQAAIGLSGRLSEELGCDLPATLLYDFPTPRAVARHLARDEDRPSAGAVARRPAGDGTADEPIAIVGIGCRLPGAAGPAAFWRLLRDGVDAVGEVPPERWDAGRFYSEDPAVPGRANTRWGGFLDGIDRFDALFFGISGREASRMDPQQRLLLEVAWEALEDAGKVPDELAGSATGVFVGISTDDYGRLQLGDLERIDAYAGTGSALCVAANRLSYTLDLQGPSLAIDTACSASLVAVHLACASLRSGESTLALAGGVNLILSPALAINFTKAGVMAPDGRCKTFDARANGYVRSEGAGLVVLEPLSRALAAGDPIYAVIRGSATSHDGRTNGLMAPSRPAQELLLRKAYRNAGVAPGRVRYVEAHGTGTLLGDPIEAGALGAVVSADRPADAPCRVGSVKTNLGHLESAAGIAGLIKVALSLKHGMLPPSLHFETPNPHIPFDDLRLKVQTGLGPWPEAVDGGPPVAGVSSFGVGGANAHVVLEEAPVRSERSAGGDERPRLLPLSARSPEALDRLARAWRELLADGEHPALGDLVHTAAVRRSHHRHRMALAFSTRDELLEQLDEALAGGVRSGVAAGVRPAAGPPRLAFVFSGQGSQWAGMGLELREREPVFREVFDACDRAAREDLGRSLIEGLSGGPEALAEIDFVQPALCAVQIALAALWRSWGVEPDAVVGHSLGEVAAAHCAGALGLDDAMKAICRRSRLLRRLSGRGAMALLALTLPEVEELLRGRESEISVAAANSPQSTVVSGDPEAIDRLLAEVEARDVFCRRVQVDIAAHSPQIEPLQPEMVAALDDLRPGKATIPIVSGVTGGFVDGEALDGLYWGRNLREPVLFSAGVDTLLEAGVETFVEVSPHPVLVGPIGQCLRHVERRGTTLPTLRRGEPELVTMLGSLGALYALGRTIDWSALFPEGACVPLPTYPWQRQRYWLEPGVSAGSETNLLAAPAGATEPEGIRPMATETPSPRAAASSEDRRADLVRELRELVGAVVQVDPERLDGSTPLVEIGVDSIVLADVARQIDSRYGVKLPVSKFFEELKTIAAVAAHLEQVVPAPAPSAAPASAAPASAVPANPSVRSVQAAAGDGSAAERIVAQQLETLSRVMAMQLEALGGGAAQPATVPASPPAARQATPAAAPVPPRPASAGRPEAFVPYQKITPGPPVVFEGEKQRHLEALVERYTRRTPGSKRLTQTYRPCLADNRASAGFRLSVKEMLYPIVAHRSEGSRIWDVDGNEYVDLTMGFGVNLFGHNPPFVVKAIEERLALGMELGPQSELAGEVARRICDLTGMERATFCNSGTEAVMTAVRLARNATGRSKIALCTGSYHGTFDGILARREEPGAWDAGPLAPGVLPQMISEVLVLDYGAPESLEALRSCAGELAAVLVEPVQSRRPDLQPREFLHELRDLTREAGAALIFDEVITGFRIHPGGAQAWFGVDADLATYGKVIGGGMPIGVVAGRSHFLDGIDGGVWQYGDNSFPRAQTTFFAGTFCKHPLAMAASHAVLEEIESAGPPLFEDLNRRTAELAATLNEHFEDEGYPLRIVHFGSLFRFAFSGNMDLLFYHLMEKGIYIWEGRNCFLSTAHDDEDVERVIDAVRESLAEMRDGGFLPPASGGGSKGSRVRERPERSGSAPAPSAAGLAPRLTDRQAEMWGLSRMREEAAAAYHTTGVLRLLGPLDTEALERAVAACTARHEALRTVIEADGETCSVLREPAIGLAIDDLSAATEEERSTDTDRWLERSASRPFGPGEPLIRADLLRAAEWEHLLALTVHQVAADGWSMGVLLEEIGTLYTAEIDGRPALLPEATPFCEFVAWQEETLASGPAAEAQAYWLERLSDPPPRLELPTDRPRPEIPSTEGAVHHLRIGGAFHSELVAWSGQNGCTLFMTLLAAYQLFLQRLTGADDLIVPVPSEGQSAMGKSRLVGDCINLLPLRLRTVGDPTVAEVLATVRRASLEALDHQEFSFPRLLRRLRPTPDPSLWPLFNLDRAPRLPELRGLTVDLLPFPIQHTSFELSLNVLPIDDDLLLSFEYRTELFDEATMERWMRLYHDLLEEMVARPPSTRVSELATAAGPPAEPLDEALEPLAGIWREVLGVEAVGPDDGFFALGGHSLLAVRLAQAVRSRFGADLMLRDLVEAPTLAGMAERIAVAGTVRERGEPAPRATTGEPEPSFAQERHWFLHEMEPDSPLFNMGGVIRFRGPFDPEALRSAFGEVLRRHDVLRAGFRSEGGRVVQRIAEPTEPEVPTIDLSGAGEGRERVLEERLESEAKWLFDLGTGPLVRLTLFRLGREEHAASLVLHHIVSDGWSMGLLARELTALYESFAAGRAPELPPPPHQYADFAVRQRAWLDGEETEQHLDFWRRELAGATAVSFPWDRAPGPVASSRGGRHGFDLPSDLVAGLRALAAGRGVTLFVPLLSAFLVLLQRLTRRDDLVVGAPVANRLAPGTEEVVGCFVDVVAVRADLSGDPRFVDLLTHVRDAATSAFDHQEVPFDKVVEALNPDRIPGRSPFFETVFNLETDSFDPPAISGLELSFDELDRGMPVKHDLTVYVRDAAEGLAMTFAYRLDLYDRRTIERIAGAYRALLCAVVAEPEARISNLELFMDGERSNPDMSNPSNPNAPEDSNLKRLMGTRRRAVPRQTSLVKTGLLESGGPLPLVVTPATDGVDLHDWIEGNRETVEKELLKHGGILFRGFDVPTSDAFHHVTEAMTEGLVNYVEGSSERIKVSDKVYTSTEYPPELFVSLHNELSYAHRWPKLIFFYCLIEPQHGGETPIADSRRVLDAMPEELKAKFLEKGVQYMRNLHGGRGAGLSWQSVFETDDRDFVERYCREGNIEFEWKADGGLRTRQVRPGIARHPITGELIWFNQADQFHPSNLGEETARSLEAISSPEDLPLYSTYGDGTPFEPEALEIVREAFQDTLVAFPWRQGDVLVLDNMLSAHGRMPFEGPRRIVVSMGDPVGLEQMPSVGSLDEPVRAVTEA